MYHKPRELKLIENQDEISEPLFKTEEEYEAFRQRFYEAVKEKNDQWKIARLNSIRESQRRWVL